MTAATPHVDVEVDPRLIEQMRPPCNAVYTYTSPNGTAVRTEHCAEPAESIVRVTCTCTVVSTWLLCAKHAACVHHLILICPSCRSRAWTHLEVEKI